MTMRDGGEDSFGLRLEDPGWYLEDPHGAFGRLRREAPVHRVEPLPAIPERLHSSLAAQSMDRIMNQLP